jgi:hypothetical protein
MYGLTGPRSSFNNFTQLQDPVWLARDFMVRRRVYRIKFRYIASGHDNDSPLL